MRKVQGEQRHLCTMPSQAVQDLVREGRTWVPFFFLKRFSHTPWVLCMWWQIANYQPVMASLWIIHAWVVLIARRLLQRMDTGPEELSQSEKTSISSPVSVYMKLRSWMWVMCTLYIACTWEKVLGEGRHCVVYVLFQSTGECPTSCVPVYWGVSERRKNKMTKQQQSHLLEGSHIDHRNHS